MRKMLILLAVAIVMANANGCCCRRLCPFLDRGACCLCPQPTYAPVAACPPAPCQPATYAPLAAPQQYIMPTATTFAPQSYVAAPVAQQYAQPYAQPCAPPCAPVCPPQPCCTKWDPCQCAVVAQPQPNYAAQAGCCPQPQAPCCPAPQAMYYAEPTCGYVDTGCCEGPSFGTVGYGSCCGGEGCSGCNDGCSSYTGGGCESGCCGGGMMGGEMIDGGVMSAPAPESYVDPTPAPE